MGKSDGRRWFGYSISVLAIAAAIGHVIWPDAKIDSATVLLLVVALVPWLGTLIESLELPGGLKLKYRSLEERFERTEQTVATGSATAANATSIAQAALGAARIGNLAVDASDGSVPSGADAVIEEMRRLRSLPHSDARTDTMDQLFGELISLTARAPDFDPAVALRDEDVDRRLTGYARLYGDPDTALTELVCDALLRERSAFNQYWAIKTLRSLVDSADTVTPAMRVALENLSNQIPRTGSRRLELDLLLRTISAPV
jgi:hypothetical protein